MKDRLLTMTDIELTRALERGDIANESFHHLSHVHVAWVYLSESATADEAAGKMRATLQKFTSSLGHAEKYHETITVFWIRFLGHMRQINAGMSLKQVAEGNPQLLEKNFVLQYYSADLLFSDRARTSWVEPDLKALPPDATSFCSSSSTRDPSDRLVSERAA